MSRIIRKKLTYPSQVSFAIKESSLSVIGPLGSVDVPTGSVVKVNLTDGIDFELLNQQHSGALGSVYIGTKNAISDVVKSFTASLKMVGVGFKASVKGHHLRLFIGFSHDVIVAIPDYLKVVVTEDVNISVTGHDRKNVMAFARAVRDMKKPEPYKGKGIYLNNEKIIRKVGKKK
jgi:large subunit ribosomal protein L6